MIYQLGSERPRLQFTPARPEMPAEMAGKNTSKEIDGPRHDHQPGCKEVQASAPSILVEDVVGPVGADRRGRIREERSPILPPAVPMVTADRQFEQRRRQAVPRVAPVKPRMRHQDDETGERQDQDARRENPVRHPHPAGMSRCARSQRWRRDGKDVRGVRGVKNLRGSSRHGQINPGSARHGGQIIDKSGPAVTRMSGIFRAAKSAEAVSNEPVRWIFAAVVTVVILALVRTFIGNARALKQDMDQRFGALQARLEKDANSLADELFTRTPDQSQE